MALESGLGILIAAGFLLSLAIMARSMLADAAARQVVGVATERQRLLDMVNLAAVMLTDANGIVLFWSEGCRRLYGWTVEQAVGRASEDLLQTIVPGLAAASGAALDRDGT